MSVIKSIDMIKSKGMKNMNAKSYSLLFRISLLLIVGLFLQTAIAQLSEKGGRIFRDIQASDEGGCLLDLYVPSNVSNFPVIVWFHGGGLTSGGKTFLPFKNKDIAQVAAGYRLLGGKAKTGVDCIEDAAAAVAWTLKNISQYGGDAKKVFVSGNSAGGYLTMMVGMDPKYLAAYGVKHTDLAAIVPITGQATKHFNVRKFGGDTDPQFLPKIDELAPLAHVSANIPPIYSICGQPPYEWKCRSEENRLLIASCVALGHKKARFIELDFCNHGQAFVAGLPYLEMIVSGRFE